MPENIESCARTGGWAEVLTVCYERLGLRPGELFLDAGAGFGRHAFEAARLGARVVVLDYAAEEVVGTRDTFAAMVEAGEIPVERYVAGLRGDATKLPFASERFDRVVTSEVLEHIQDDVSAIAELARVLKPGGALGVTVPTWWPEKINWMLSDEYHAPKSIGGHVRIYTLTELKAKLRSAGLEVYGSHHAHALHSPYWWPQVRRGSAQRRPCPREQVPPVPRMGHRRGTSLDAGRGEGAVAGVGKERDRVCPKARSVMSRLPDLDGVLGADELHATAESVARLQLPNGMIPWNDGGHCDPWNHVETAMALDVAGMHREAERAYEWMAEIQREDGSWFNYYRSDGSVEDAKLDTNVCAYGVRGVAPLVVHLGPRLRRPSLADRRSRLDWVVSMQLPTGAILWAREVDSRPWDYALLTGSSSIHHALECGLLLADMLGEDRIGWRSAADHLADAIRNCPDAFEPKTRWAMDWYYPVLTNVLTGEAASAPLLDVGHVRDGRLGIRCVSDEPWVTAAETAECSMAHAAAGDFHRDRSPALDPTAPQRGRVLPDRPVHPDVISFPSMRSPPTPQRR
ncbi:MAG: methyltransferase domain-containing protein [Ilumatobacteraceae bacterium]